MSQKLFSAKPHHVNLNMKFLAMRQYKLFKLKLNQVELAGEIINKLGEHNNVSLHST
jgi:hypothetical protein